MENVVREILSEIDNANNIALFTHVNCDGDGLACMSALYEYLEDSGKNCQMFCDSDLPEKYSFIRFFDEINANEFEKYDLLISLDTATLKRIGKYGEDFQNHRNTINIDHHKSNTEYAKINFVKSASSCGEVLYEMLKDGKKEITDGIATSIFSAISSDTNCFINEDISDRTFGVVSELIQRGANFDLVNLHLHKNKSLNQLKLAGLMAKKLTLKNKVAFLYLTYKEIKKMGTKSSDASTFLPLICNVGDSKITVFMKKRENGEYRVNLRSVGNYDVNKVASNFGGGGHVNAAGCTVSGNYKKLRLQLLKKCYEEIERNAKLDPKD